MAITTNAQLAEWAKRFIDAQYENAKRKKDQEALTMGATVAAAGDEQEFPVGKVFQFPRTFCADCTKGHWSHNPGVPWKGKVVAVSTDGESVTLRVSNSPHEGDTDFGNWTVTADKLREVNR